MKRFVAIAAIFLFMLGLPFLLKQAAPDNAWQTGDLELVIISPNNEAIRFEFGLAFSRWHQERFGQPVKVDWRAIGGTSEIMRYLEGAYTASLRAYWLNQGKPWPTGGAQAISGGNPPAENSLAELYRAFRASDDPNAISAGIDLFFGGGEYDHGVAFKHGLTVAPWPDNNPPLELRPVEGIELIPRQLSGETWRTSTLFGVALSTFGICYNKDRLDELGLPPPKQWDDLADPRFYKQIGLADPTKSGSIAKAYEMIIQQKIHQALRADGFDDATIDRYETALEMQPNNPWVIPPGVPAHYQETVESGWRDGLSLIRRIAANSRYFTDSASKVAIDVSKGDAASGLVIDFYGRYQAEHSRGLNGRERMAFVTPVGGSSVSSDPISLLRGAAHKEIAKRFLQFAMSESGQQLWNYQPGEKGGPVKYALRRLPARRSFYPAEQAGINNLYLAHRPHLTDDLGDPAVNPYEIAKTFTYRRRWTAKHFNIHRQLIKAMCLDAGDELKSAWESIQQHGGTANNPTALAALETFPADLNWRSAIDGYARQNPLDYTTRWLSHFRQAYKQAKTLAEANNP